MSENEIKECIQLIVEMAHDKCIILSYRQQQLLKRYSEMQAAK